MSAKHLHKCIVCQGQGCMPVFRQTAQQSGVFVESCTHCDGTGSVDEDDAGADEAQAGEDASEGDFRA